MNKLELLKAKMKMKHFGNRAIEYLQRGLEAENVEDIKALFSLRDSYIQLMNNELRVIVTETEEVI
jgi:hypothetical protein